jgi:hypothetical protein
VAHGDQLEIFAAQQIPVQEEERGEPESSEERQHDDCDIDRQRKSGEA